MAFQEMAFDPVDGLQNKSTYPTTPTSEEAARELLQALPVQIRDYINNILLAALESSTTDASGADNIGSAPISGVEVSSGISAVTVRQQLVAIKAIAAAASAGTLVPGSISNANMFAAGVVALAAMAENSVGSDQYVDGSIGPEHLAANAVTTNAIAALAVTAAKLTADAVETAKIKDLAVTESKLAAKSVTQTKIGDDAVGTDQLGTVQTITLDSGDTITYDTAQNQLKLNVSGCVSVNLCPMIYGTDENPAAGTYPKGTLYIQHQV